MQPFTEKANVQPVQNSQKENFEMDEGEMGHYPIAEKVNLQVC